MINTMNDYDFEEKLLLNSLSDYSNNNHQQYPYAGMTNTNISISNYNNNNNYYNSNTNYEQQYYEHENSLKSYEPRHFEELKKISNHSNQVASTVSMSTEEEAFDDFNLFDDDHPEMEVMSSDNVDVRMTFSMDSTTQKSDKLPNNTTPKLSRRISSHEESEERPKKRKVVYNQKPKQNNSKENHITNEGTLVEKPTDSDVLCGQSRTCSNHPGNKRFQQILEDFSYQYDIATSKQEKMCMTKEIVSIIHNCGGRFLRLKHKMWEEISTVAARDKVSHALRTKAASRKKREEQILQNGGYQPPPSSPSSRRKSRSPSFSRNSIRQHRRESRSRRSSDPSVSPVDASSSVINGLMKSTHDMFSTLVTPANSTNTNHRRSHSAQPKTYNTTEDYNEPIPFHRSDSEPFRQIRF